MLKLFLALFCIGVAAAVPSQLSAQSNPLQQYFCQLCQDQLSLFLGEPQKLLGAVNLYCDQLTGSNKTTCLMIANGLLTPLAAEINQLDVGSVCQKLSVCPTENSFPAQAPPTSVTPECDLCQVGVGYLNAFIAEPISHAAWKHLISSNLCPLFKVPSLVASCNAVTTDTFDSFVKSIATGYTVDILCVGYNVCPTSPVEMNQKVEL